MTADAVAFELGLHDAVATTRCIFDDDRRLVDLYSAGDEQHAKVTVLADYCIQKNINLNDCVVIGDGPNDIPLFRSAAVSVTFTNAPKEARVAATHTIDNLTELPQLL